MNIHQRLGEYSNAAQHFDQTVQNMLKALGEVLSKGAALPVPAHDAELAERLDNLRDSAWMNLQENYTVNVVPAVKAKGKEIANG